MTGAERIETILAEQRCRDVHAERWRGAKGVHRVCESCTGWGKHVAVLVAAETGGVPASPELTCGDCRLPYATWFADNEVWNLVIGGPEAKGDPGGMLCPRCFTLRAEKVYTLAIWHLRLDRVNREPVAAAEAGGLAEVGAALADDPGWRSMVKSTEMAPTTVAVQALARYAETGWTRSVNVALLPAQAEAWLLGRAVERNYAAALAQYAHWSNISSGPPVDPPNPFRALLVPDQQTSEGSER